MTTLYNSVLSNSKMDNSTRFKIFSSILKNFKPEKKIMKQNKINWSLSKI
jgi:hypothetical protein